MVKIDKTLIKFEALFTDKETVARKLAIKDEYCIDYNPQSTYIYKPLERYKCVYSEMFDEYLNYKDMKTLKDDTSILYIFELDDPMYTMESVHNIGLKNFDNAMLVVEYLLVPKKQSITEDDRATIDEWYFMAKEATMDNLQNIINHIMNDYTHSYGTYVHAVTACTIATAWACGKELSGFQASCVGLEFLMHWTYDYVKTGVSIRNWDNMLYPQYEDYFDKVIPKSIWEKLQKEAQSRVDDFYNNIDANEYIMPMVIKHQKSIAYGNPPFGYSIKETT